MVNRRLVTLLLAALVGIGTALYLRAQNDPRAREIRRIQKHLLQLASAVSFTERDTPFQRLAYPGGLPDYFTDPAHFQIAIGRYVADQPLSHAELRDATTAIRAQFRGLSVQFLDIVVDLAPDPDQATVHLTSKIYFTGDSDYWIQEFRLALARTESTWRIQRLATLRTMER